MEEFDTQNVISLRHNTYRVMTKIIEKLVIKILEEFHDK